MKKVTVGDRVTTKIVEPAFYSGYGINPVQEFKPGMVGVVAKVNVPCVTHRKGSGDPLSYNCIDFIGDKGKLWRVSLYSRDMVKAA